MTEPPQCIPFDRLVPIFLRSQGGKSYGDGDLDASRSAAIELRDMLRDRGWALISLGDSVASDKITRDHGRVLSAQRREELVDSLFDGDVAAVQGSCPIDSNNELGVREHVELGKRFFAYRRGSERFPDVETSNLSQLEVFDDQQALTSPSLLFERRVKELWRSCEYVSRVVLAAVADSLGVEPKLLLDLCSLPSKEYESNCEGERDESMLHLFDYYSPPSDQMAMNLGCPEHTDSGLITCIPASSNGAGLECLDWQSFEFLNAEAQPNSIAVLVGETLSRLTCCYFRGTVHRVGFKGSRRKSTPFQLRGRPDAVLDSAGVFADSDLIEVPSRMRQRITISDFIS